LSDSWRVLVRLFGDTRRLLVWSTVLSIIQSMLVLPIAVLVQRIFDRVVHRGHVGTLVLDGALILILYLASAAIGLWMRHIVLGAVKAAVTRLRMDLLASIYRLPQSYFDRHRLAELHSTIVQDSQLLDRASNVLVAQLLPATIMCVALSAVLIVEDAVLFAVLLAVVPLLLLTGNLLGRGVKRRTRSWRTAFDQFSGQTHLALRAVTLTKVQGAERSELARSEHDLELLGQADRSMSWLYSAYGVVQGAVSATAGVVVLIVGGVAVVHGSMSLGKLLSFYAILGLLLRQITLVQGGIPTVLGGSIPLERLEKILDAPDPQPYSGTLPLDFKGSLRLEHVDFAYGSEPLLRGVDLVIAPGEHVAILGPNGAGKSTVVSLMLGLYRPDSGRVLVDDVPLEDVDVTALRRRIGVVLQNPLIFPGTVAENIAYGHPQATADEIRRAAKLATADDFIDGLPDGYDTQTGDEGALLSGGQRQRIAIARALIGNPRLLVLDEPTTHLDDATIADLSTNLRAFPGSPAVLMITHDSQVASQADVVYTLRDGSIVAAERAAMSSDRT
jgi:ABC-type bacteriocin/lantibiotic exporter with double-glycine peptidase domain